MEDFTRNTKLLVMTGSVIKKDKVTPGAVYGKLTSLYLVDGFTKRWYCQCKCMIVVEAYECDLLNGKKKSCGRQCKAQGKDYTDKKFAYLKAIKFIRMDSYHSATWLFECICSKKVELRVAHVTSGRTKSCGCKKEDLRRKYTILPNSEAIKNRSYRQHISGAQRRGYESYLTKKDYVAIILKGCLYCGGFSTRKNTRTGEVILLNSADRINNEPYYSLENTVSSCFNCQKAKEVMAAKNFITMCVQVAEYQRHI